MDVAFFIIWVLCALWCFLIIPIDNKIQKLDDNNRIKRWWVKNMVSNEPSKDN
jgi:hypothetical protein